jgi:pyruvate dehydrogenase E1 component alpha subunit
MAPPEEKVLVSMYETMSTIKQCDERFRSMITSGQIMITYYPPRGQEVIAAALGATLATDDYLVTTYRGMHDSIAKGVSLRALWAEYLGRRTGTCKGKGGPMHLTDRASGVMVTTGIVGGGLPIGAGLAMSSQVRGDGRVTAVTFGDGATSIGAFHEALNLASLWKLPVVFVCQNNGYAEMTTFAKGQPVERVAERAAAYAMPGVTVDGNDALATYAALDEAVRRARDGGGPTLVEATTYRFWGHYFGDGMAYMPAEEREAAMAADPVPRYRTWLLEQDYASEDQLSAIDAAAAEAIDDAVAFALASDLPEVDEITKDVYGEAVPA